MACPSHSPPSASYVIRNQKFHQTQTNHKHNDICSLKTLSIEWHVSFVIASENQYLHQRYGIRIQKNIQNHSSYTVVNTYTHNDTENTNKKKSTNLETD